MKAKVVICDVCGKRILGTCGDIRIKYRAKRKCTLWYEDWWERIDICADCLNKIISAKEKGPEDCISREEAIKEFQVYREYSSNMTNDDWVDRIETVLRSLPTATPKFTDDEIQKMQELEHAQLEKAYDNFGVGEINDERNDANGKEET